MRMSETNLRIYAYRKTIENHQERIGELATMFANGEMSPALLKEHGTLHGLIERYNAMIEHLGGKIS